MKPVTDSIVNPRAEAYAEGHTSEERAELSALSRWAHLHTTHPRMVAGHWQGRLLEMISCMVRPQKAVEIGSFLGYSTRCLALGLAEEGVLHTIEVEEEYEEAIRRATADLGDRVRLHIGPALDIIPTLEGPFDLAFIDADKQHNREYYDLLVPRMRGGGFILIDNVLWSGKVLHPEENSDRDTQALLAFNDYVQNDPRTDNVLLPVRDGLMVCCVSG